MSWWQRLRRRGQLEGELDSELRYHYERQVEDNLRAGMPEREARRRARLDFGGHEQVKEECREARGGLWLEETLRDIRFAWRTLWKSPAFAGAAIGTLALGIGANVAVFAVFHAVVLKPLPYAEPERLVAVAGVVPQLRARFASIPMRARDFDAYQRSNSVFSAMSALQSRDFNLTGEGEPQRLYGARVSANLFSLLGVHPERGRSFAPEEDQPGRDRVVVISHELWKRQFGADPGVLNRTVLLDGEGHDVIGIMPERFLFPTGAQLHPRVLFGPRVDVWKPMAFRADELEHQGNWAYACMARLKPGVGLDRAHQDLDVIARTVPFPDGLVAETQIVPLRRVFSGDARAGLTMLLGAVALLLLIACVNLANLFLAQMSARGREFATRAALGARRGRLARQVLTEVSLVASIGAAAGFVVAQWATQVLLSLRPAASPALQVSGLHGPVLVFTAAVAVATGAAVGVTPALQMARGTLYENLVTRGAAAGPRTGRLRRGLIATEVALSTALLLLAGLLLHSFVKVMNVDKGFTTESILTADLSLSSDRYTPPRMAAFYQELTERVSGAPGVVSAGIVTAPPLRGQSGRGESGPVYFETDTDPSQTPERPFAVIQSATPGLFPTLRIPVLAGRLFEDDEPVPVTAISADLARGLWPDETLGSAVGRRVKLNHSAAEPVTIVGIVGDVRGDTLESEPAPAAYRPQSQAPFGEMTLVVRTRQPPESLASTVRREVWRIDKDLPVASMRTMRAIVSASTAERRFQMVLLVVFATLSLVLAAVGIYGVTSYTVSGRTHEIGVRMALGARGRDVLLSVLEQGLRPVAAGLAVGLAGAAAAATLVRSLLFGVQPLDPLSLGGVCLVLLVVATVACYVPARRAASVDPAVTLRSE
jgi:putative ABC transport system permease protein